MTAELREIQYLVLPNAQEPFLLARVRWPDVYQAISAVRPDWQDDPGLFDLPYAANSTRLTREEAERVATGWGVRLPAEDEPQPKGAQLIRRMPSDWSKLSTAERRAWSIPAGKATRRAPIAAFATFARPADYAAPQPKTRRWGRRTAAMAPIEAPPYPEETPTEAELIDLPEPRKCGDPGVEAAPTLDGTTVADHSAAEHAGSSALVMNLSTGTWRVDPISGEAETPLEGSSAEDSDSTALSIDLTETATKRLRRGRRAAKQAKTTGHEEPAVIDLTDDKESAESAADHV